MKKYQLTMASALLGVLLVTGMAHAESTTAKAPLAAPAQTQEMKKPGMPMPMCDKTMMETMKKVRADNKALFEEMEAKHKEIEAIVKAPTFDKAAFLAKHQEMDALHTKMAVARSQAIADAYEKMTPQERAALKMGGRMHHGMKCGEMDGKGMMGKSMMKEDGSAKGMMEHGAMMTPGAGQPAQPAGK